LVPAAQIKFITPIWSTKAALPINVLDSRARVENRTMCRTLYKILKKPIVANCDVFEKAQGRTQAVFIAWSLYQEKTNAALYETKAIVVASLCSGRTRCPPDLRGLPVVSLWSRSERVPQLFAVLNASDFVRLHRNIGQVCFHLRGWKS